MGKGGQAANEDARCHTSDAERTVRIIRVFVSSPGDVFEEREVLGEACNSINRTDGQARSQLEEGVLAGSREVPQLLLDLLADRSLYVSGDPGSGKSTFCRWVTWLTCNGTMPPSDLRVREPYQERFPEGLRGSLPVLVRRWFVRLDENRERGLETANAMIAHLHGERALDELAANPLLLTAMCIIYGEGKRLPADKHELYDRIVDTVLHKRYPAVRERVSEVRGRLAAVALGMHTGEGLGQQRTNPEASASDHEIDLLLEKYHQEDGVRDQGLADIVHVRDDLLSNSGLLVSSRDRRASFYHLSFQEFMAAERLFLKLSLERLFVRQEGKQEGFTGLLIERGQASGWRNTLVFLFGCVVSRFNPHAGVELLQAVVSRKELPGRDISQKGQAGSGRQE